MNSQGKTYSKLKWTPEVSKKYMIGRITSSILKVGKTNRELEINCQLNEPNLCLKK